MEEKAWDNDWWIPVIVEEIGEIARSRNEYNLGNISLQTHKNELRKEAVQVGAMVAAWLDALS
jgi:NTP pyrophosphatase (non-canonical NTP hydrolase)